MSEWIKLQKYTQITNERKTEIGGFVSGSIRLSSDKFTYI